MAYRILVVEDDRGLNQGICLALQREEFIFDTAYTLKEAWKKYQEKNPDMVLLDVNFPDGNGFDFLRMLRQSSNIPVLVVTANDMETDEVTGLTLGADDYITKPFKLAIFMSRINALLRRSENFNTAVTELNSNDISIRLLKGEVYKRGKLLDLTASEYKLLCLFMENPDQILSPEQILGKLWDCSENYIDNNSLTVYIRRLRTKIEDNPGEPKRIVTVRGMGYKWNTEEPGI